MAAGWLTESLWRRRSPFRLGTLERVRRAGTARPAGDSADGRRGDGGWRDPPNLHPHRMHVVARPVLRDQAASHPADVNFVPHNAPSGGGNPEDRPEMSAGDPAVLGDEVTFFDFLNDLILKVRKAGTLIADDLLDALNAAVKTGRPCVIDEIWCQHLVENLHPAFAERLQDDPA